MKLNVVMTSSFRKDIKRLKKRGYNIALLEAVVEMLANCQELPPKYSEHRLSGNWSGFMECHILPDWIMVYRIINEELILTLQRTGTHSDLF